MNPFNPFVMNPPLGMSGSLMNQNSFMGMNPITPQGMCPYAMPSFMNENSLYESKIKNLEEELRQKNEENRNLKQRLINNGTININQNYNSMNTITSNRNTTPKKCSRPYREPKVTYNDKPKNIEVIYYGKVVYNNRKDEDDDDDDDEDDDY